jgi:hypothetical protein
LLCGKKPTKNTPIIGSQQEFVKMCGLPDHMIVWVCGKCEGVLRRMFDAVDDVRWWRDREENK